MAVSLRLNDDAELHGVSVSKLFRQAIMNIIENEYDLSVFNRAM